MRHWLLQRLPLLHTWKSHFSEYYVPKNLNWLYLMGFLALLLLFNQVLTGLWLTMFYTPTASEAFDSIQSIMRDVPYGWLFRYLHTTGASTLFVVLFLHLFRGILYGSYQAPRDLVWLLGMGLFVLLLGEAFFGYLLPWGQLSYWGAQVMTSVLGAIPFVGDTLVLWIRGDYQVSSVTLHRFFALHIVAMPLLIIGLVYLHVIALHHVGSNNPEGIDIRNHLDKQGKPLDGIPFYPHYVKKDARSALVFLMLFFAVVFFVPDMGGLFIEGINAVPANPQLTPETIRPVWYLTPFYSILRAVPNQLLGIFLALASLLCLGMLPWLDASPVRSMHYKGKLSKIALVLFVFSILLLAVLGMAELTSISLWVSRICVVIYFAFFILMPVYTRREQCCTPPTRVTAC